MNVENKWNDKKRSLGPRKMIAEEDCADKSVSKKIHHNPAGNICVQLLLIKISFT